MEIVFGSIILDYLCTKNNLNIKTFKEKPN